MNSDHDVGATETILQYFDRVYVQILGDRGYSRAEARREVEYRRRACAQAEREEYARLRDAGYDV